MNQPSNKKDFWKINWCKKYNVIYADPPWKYSNTDVSKHYPCISIKEIYKFPIHYFSDKNCALFLWTPLRILPEAIETLRRWGFRYVTVAFNWIKTNKTNGRPFLGMGGWTRANSELCLLGLKGRLKRNSGNVSQVVLSQRREHSRKPDEVRERIVGLLGNLPRIELFARQTMPGWDCWGDETTKFNKREVENGK